MPTSLLALLITLRSILRSRLHLQIEILKFCAIKSESSNARFINADSCRLLWVSLSRFWRVVRQFIVPDMKRISFCLAHVRAIYGGHPLGVLVAPR